jgi:large repetitive protein
MKNKMAALMCLAICAVILPVASHGESAQTASAADPIKTFPLGEGAAGAVWIEAADVNGDGLLDLVTANESSNNLSVLLNDGKGGFLPAIISPPTGSQPKSVALADFNGDGKIDAVTANFGSGTMSVFFGNGDGTFQPALNFPIGIQTQSVVVGDLNNDGLPDIVIASVQSENYEAYLSNGDGTFTGPITFTFDNGYAGMTQIKLGDMDGDGILDVVGIYGYGQGFQVWRGRGDGSFYLWSHSLSYGTIPYPNGLALGDFNGDGALDVALGDYQYNVIGVSKNEGDGYFSQTVDSPSSTATILLAVGHLDSDRFPDAVSTGLTASTLDVSYGLGKGMFSAPTKYHTGHTVAAVVGRFGRSSANSIAYTTGSEVGLLRPTRSATAAKSR